jgi:redox-sensitive bicupin YhaK (pirin superfamily)
MGVNATNTRLRRIVARTRGERVGEVTRLFGPWAQRHAPYHPSEFAELVKPFVFMDVVDSKAPAARTDTANHLHPHSGLATLTYLTAGSVTYEDTSGLTGEVYEGDVEWFHAGKGAWHGGGVGPDGCRAFQLWVALPPEAELAEVESVYLTRKEVPQVGPAAILMGSYCGTSSPLRAPSDLTYLAIRLKAGETWRYQPPAGHTVTWIAVNVGALRTPEAVEAREAVAFEASEAPVEFEAMSDSEFVLGSAVRHPHPLALGHYSVHTSPEALRQGQSEIRTVRERLVADGRLHLE